MYKTIISALLALIIQFNGYSQDVSILFEVNMTYQIQENQFDPENEFVDIAGSFNGWGSTLTKLSDQDMDSVYSVELDGFTPGEEIAFKFRINGEWNNREEFPGAGNNRYYTVQPDSNHVYVWYNDEVNPTGPPQADFIASSTEVFTNSLVQFENRSSGNITKWEWFFEGGNPAESSDEHPAVRYNQTGSFDVRLIASNDTESDTLFAENYITVAERETGDTEWWNERVFYEIFVRSFYDSDGDGIGDFNGITQKLDYLNDGDPETDSDLGIGGIWLMPIHDSPTYHGYDVIDYRSINPDYGTMEDFKNFLDAAHERGIKVIIDYVMNHTSTKHPWFEQSAAGDPHFRDFYRWSDTDPGYAGPWGQQVWHNQHNGQNYGDYYYGVFWSGMPDLNYDNPAVKDSMFAISDFWINEIGVDGFRQDAVLYIHEDGQNLKNTEGTFQFWNDFNVNLKAANPDAFAVGEAWEPTNIALQYMTENRLDYVFEFDLAQSILAAVNNEEAAPVISQMQKVYDDYPFLQYGTFLTNHDQDRVMNVLGQDVNKAKLAASLYLTLPGIPYVYYGEEVGMLGQKPDPDIRLPMQWSDEANAGFSSSQPWRSPNSNYAEYNVEVMQSDENSLFNHYRKLIQLRSKTKELSTGNYEAAITDSPSIMGYARYDGEELPVIVVHNFSNEIIHDGSLSFTFSTLPGNSIGLLESGTIFGEPEGSGLQQESEDEWVLPVGFIRPYSTKIYQIYPGALNSESADDPESFSISQNYPNPFNPTTNISFYLPKPAIVELNVFDITGRLVSTILDRKMNAGNHTQTFDASELSSGVYFYQIKTDGFSNVRKMTLIK